MIAWLGPITTWPKEVRLAVAVTASRARELALALDETSEAPHFDRTAFRTPRRIFATLASDGADVNFMFDIQLQEFYCEHGPRAFSPVRGGWGKRGATRCLLKEVEVAMFRSALAAAHRRAQSPRSRKVR